VAEWASLTGTALAADRALAPDSPLVVSLAAKAGLPTTGPAFPVPALPPPLPPAAAANLSAGAPTFQPPPSSSSSSSASMPMPPPPPPRNYAPTSSSASPAAALTQEFNGHFESAQRPAWARNEGTVVATFLSAFCASPAHQSLNPGALSSCSCPGLVL